MNRKTAILGLCTLLAVILAAGSVAETAFMTSASDSENTPVHESPGKRIVRSSAKRKRTIVSANLTTAKPAAVQTLLPAVDKADITPHHRKLADQVLRTLPSGCRDNLRNFFVQYQNVKSRGLGGKTTIIITGNVPDEEFAGLLTHECGHVLHSNLMGTSAGQKTAFVDGKDSFMSDSPIVPFFSISWTEENILRADAREQDFVSGYAEADAFEDFAESFAMYILHRDAFEERAKTNTAIAAKLNWMKQNIPVADDLLGSSGYIWEKTVPWDVTKLPIALAIQQ